MRKVYFLLGIHNHQPVGNFPHVLEQAYQESYRPFLEVMSKHPKIKWSLHCTGILWDFIKEKHPEYMETVRSMVRSGQVELLSGGYYEPILSVIPDRDKIGQIQKLTAFLKSEFSYDARGMWLAERVWEPQLARALADAGMTFTVVDDAHFAAAGLDVEKLRGYYMTEEQGTKLAIFPISQRLRYHIPFQTVEKNIEYFSSCARESGCPALVMADDGEKFGLWPETFKHVYHDRWLDNFLTALDNNSEWLETITFSEYMSRCAPEGRVYLPAASYFEMSEWSLPTRSQEDFEGIVKQNESRPDIKRFLRGGFWRNFLTKYAESNNIHKKMLYVSGKVDRKASRESEVALDALYAGQCNCAYWHGVFGGLYLPHLRNALYERLLEAEITAGGQGKKARWHEIDFDCDGMQETLYESATQNLYFAPAAGGTLFEWDILFRKVNLLNVLTRREEAYHKRLRDFLANPHHQDGGVKTIHDMVKVKERNLDNYLHNDWYRRSSLIDHFLHPETTFEGFRQCKYGEQGDFVLGTYSAEASARQLLMKREGTVWDGNRAVRLEVRKKISPSATGMKITYCLTSREKEAASVTFAPEFNYAFSIHPGGDPGAIPQVRQWTRKDVHFGLEVKMDFNEPVDVWTFPLETVSLSEGGFERTYQGTVVLPVYRIVLEPGKASELTISVEVTDTRSS